MGRLVDVLRRRMQMLREDAQAVASVVEDAFQGGSEIDDDALDAELRQLFYDLQDAKVLGVARREYTKQGQTLRGYTWQVLDEVDRQQQPLRPTPEIDPDAALDEALGDQAWQRRTPGPA